MATASKLLTYEEWLQMPAPEYGRDEVVKGEYRLIMPAPHSPHPVIINELTFLFHASIDRTKVRVLSSWFGLVICKEPPTFCSPDIALYWKERIVIEKGNFVSAPDLIVEVLSPSENRRRKEEKMEDYASIGTPEAWLVSPEAQTIEVRILRNGKLERTGIAADGTLEPTRFPGVSIPVTEIWPD
jgi:Uma2 family endonuclease